jgi:hypothetical protein
MLCIGPSIIVTTVIWEINILRVFYHIRPGRPYFKHKGTTIFLFDEPFLLYCNVPQSIFRGPNKFWENEMPKRSYSKTFTNGFNLWSSHAELH